MSKVDLVSFMARFNVALNDLNLAEKVTRSTLMELSRTVLVVVHETGDIGYVNRILAVLTPMNKKTAIEFFKEFSGFKWDDKKGEFSTKDKKHFDAKVVTFAEWLEDPLNNLWSWAEKNLEVTPKDFDFTQLKKGAESLLKRADKNGFKKVDVLRAMMESGITADELIEFMQTLPGVEMTVTA